ncbi:MAG: DUF4394 domain-containing protein [Acidimicrobiales bacterium]
MQRHTRLAAAIAGALAAGLLTASVAGAHDDRHRDRPTCSGTDRTRSLDVVALTADSTLLCVDARNAGRPSRIGTVSGLTVDTTLVGIDYRPATGVLYGLGEQGGIYTIDAKTAAATLVSRMNVALSGTSFGIDFNPTVDRLRVVSDTQQNLRVDVTTGATLVDLTLSGAGVAGAGYTNNDADPNTATTLFDIDAANDQVSIQAPPNNGNLNPTGKLGVDTTGVVGFDIHSQIDDGTTEDVQAYASLTVGGKSGLYKINLITGRASHRGTFPVAVTDIAIPLDQL